MHPLAGELRAVLAHMQWEPWAVQCSAMINGQASAMNKDTLQTQQHKTANNTNLRYWWCHVLSASHNLELFLHIVDQCCLISDLIN